MERYDSYKDSGVEWIGKIPTNWSKIKIKNTVDPNRKITYGIVQPGKEDPNGTLMIRGKDYSNGWVDVSEVFRVSSEVEIPYSRSRVKRGDIVYTIVGGVGNVEVVPEEYEGSNLTQTTGRISVKDGIISKWVYHSLQSELNPVQIKLSQVGSVIPGISLDTLKNFFILLPPLSEQQQIVSFLDNKTSLIDSLIEKTQRKIELLKEKKTSLINEVVTKGLNPNVEMKDSGVEWIGEIPIDWDIPSLNKISNITRLAGYEYTSYWEEDVNGEIEVLRGQNIGFGEIIEKNIDRISNELSMRLIRSRLFKGDLVFPCVGTIGNCVVINEDDRYHINQNISKITPLGRVNSNFLCYYLLSHSTKFQIMFFNTSEVQPSVLVGNLRRFKICLPPIVVQQQIVEYLDEQTGLIDKTISIEEKRIELLKEYRQSLISEVVTGKRKVV
jgi:type I restriction enzyme, S subunit